MAAQFPREGGIAGLEGIDHHREGIPSMRIIAAYCQRTGRTGIDNWSFYMAFCFFQWPSCGH